MDVNLLDLRVVRKILMRLEDTIIFLMIERAQFAHNPVIYEEPGQFPELEQDREGSFMGWMLRQTEITHAKVRRYDSPDEYPFTPRDELPPPILPPVRFPQYLHPHNVNVNSKIKSFYVKEVVGALAYKLGKSNTDGHYGSSAVRDIEILQAVSRRIHYGKFVAESKFRLHPQDFIPLIRSGNQVALEKLITKPEVEAELIGRLERKAFTYGEQVTEDLSDPRDPNQATRKLDAQFVVRMYKDWVIPMTRQVEVDYLLQRLNGLSDEDLQLLIKNAGKEAAPESTVLNDEARQAVYSSTPS